MDKGASFLMLVRTSTSYRLNSKDNKLSPIAAMKIWCWGTEDRERSALAEAGANIVVDDLGKLSYDVLKSPFLKIF